MGALVVSEVRPQWIELYYQPSSGMDYLGLGSVSSDRILASLSPGINVLTVHPRYYSFYVFLLDEFWRRNEGLTTRQRWRAFFRPRDFAYSVACNLCQQPEHGAMFGIVGSNSTHGLARQRDRFDTTYHYIDSPFSGYGLYYRTVMAELGVIYIGGQGFPTPIDIPSEHGRELAEAFRSAIRDTRYYKEYFDRDEVEIEKDVLQEYGHVACLCQTRKDDAPDRQILLGTFLHGGAGETPSARRSTFRLFLDIAQQTDGIALEQNGFRQLVYFGEKEDGAHYTPASDEIVDVTYRRWRLYQAREYYSFALNALWRYVCDWGTQQGGDLRPIPINHLWEHVDQDLTFAPLANAAQLDDPLIDAQTPLPVLLDWLQQFVDPYVDDRYAQGGFTAPLHEHHLYRMERRGPAGTTLPGMLSMLGLVYLRFSHRELAFTSEWEIARMGDSLRLSMERFIRSVRDWLGEGSPTVGDLIRWLLRDYIIHQHQVVAGTKYPNDTFRFRWDGRRLRFFNLPTPVDFMNSRYDAIATTVAELGLCGRLHEGEHSLTADGEVLLEEGDLHWSS